jgi:hypothetical protein
VSDDPVPPTPSVYNYATFEEVSEYFNVDEAGRLYGFNEDEEGYDEVDFIEYMEQNTLNGIDFGNHITSIFQGAFSESKSMISAGCVKAIKISGNIDIQLGAFQYCDGLEEITLGDGEIHIGINSFIDCSNLTKVGVGSNASIISLGYGAFGGCDKLTSRNQILITDSNLQGIGH